jgi:cyclic pyranopterin phosphate synthase
MLDPFDRKITYLRLSLTKVCNFRCSYCLPEGEHWGKVNNLLNVTEIKHLIQALTELGLRKVRLTGGEPTLRKDFLEIATMLGNMPSLKTLALTSNGYQLDKQAIDYFNAGISAINISLDSLNEKIFERVTKSKKFYSILNGIEQCLSLGFDKVKINAVLLKSVNANPLALDEFLNFIKDRAVSVRFIELMKTADGLNYHKDEFISAQTFIQQLLQKGWVECERLPDSGPAKEFKHPDYCGRIGFITPYSNVFCSQCNRIRISSLGELHTCLFSSQGVSLRELLHSSNTKDELKQKIQACLSHKEKSHFLLEGKSGKQKHFSSIGG